MSTTKRISGDYNIASIEPSDNVVISTHTVTINGNLDVLGNTTQIETTELTVEDPFITVSSNNTGNLSTALFQEQGLVTQSSSNSFAGIRFNNSTEEWEISPSVAANGAPVTAYQPIGLAAAANPGGDNNDIQFKASANSFGGNSNFTFNGSDTVTLTGQLVYANIGSTPSATANAVTLYSKVEGSGGTGMYIKSNTADEELVSKSKAIVFGIIF